MSNIITEAQNRIKVKLIKVLEGFRGKDAKIEVKKLSDGTDIDTVLEEGEYFIEKATCSSGLPTDLPLHCEKANTASHNGVCAYIKVVKTKTESDYPTLKTTQICLFFPYGTSAPGYLVGSALGSYIRCLSTYEESKYWENIKLINSKRVIDCGISVPGGNIFIPSIPYPNTIYLLGRIFESNVVPLTSLTLTNLPNSPESIIFYFKTGETFSGITASDIKGWIGSTTLDTNSVYKITITNLIGKIEKLTMVE